MLYAIAGSSVSIEPSTAKVSVPPRVAAGVAEAAGGCDAGASDAGPTRPEAPTTGSGRTAATRAAMASAAISWFGGCRWFLFMRVPPLPPGPAPGHCQ